MARTLAFALALPAALAYGEFSLDAQQCPHGARGPPCKADADCTQIQNCVRCSHHGFCTDVPLGPGPSPGPSPGPPHPHGGGGCTPSNKSYDFLILVQGWPQSWCMTHKCSPDFADKPWFMLHGLWPSRGGALASSYPCQCDTTPFNESAVASIHDDLTKYWASYSSDQQFWEHEWSKHGTCMEDNPRTRSVLPFFSTALQLREQHDIVKAMGAAGIKPSDTDKLTVKKIGDALAAIGGGSDPMLGCVFKGGVQYLHEVTYCFDKSLSGIACDPGLERLKGDEVSDCDATKDIVWQLPALDSSPALVV